MEVCSKEWVKWIGGGVGVEVRVFLHMRHKRKLAHTILKNLHPKISSSYHIWSNLTHRLSPKFSIVTEFTGHYNAQENL